MYNEQVSAAIKDSQKKFLASPSEMALNSAHGLAFHRGLGTPLSPSSSVPTTKYLDAETIEAFSWAAYSKPNVAVVANGADQAQLQKWVGQYFAASRPAPPGDVPELKRAQTKYYGGEERIAHSGGNTMVIAFPGSSSFTGPFYKPEIAVLAALLGGQSAIKWSPGFSILSNATAEFTNATVSTKSHIYSDAGLLAVTISGSSKDVSGAALKTVQAIKEVAGGKLSKEDFKKAVANAKFKELEFGQNIWAGIELTGAGLVAGGKAYQIDETAKAIDGVTEAKLKEVSSRHHLLLSSLTSGPGCQVVARVQAKCCNCWRHLRTAIRRGAWAQRVNTFICPCKINGCSYIRRYAEHTTASISNVTRSNTGCHHICVH